MSGAAESTGATPPGRKPLHKAQAPPAGPPAASAKTSPTPPAPVSESELEALRARLQEAEEMLRAIRLGEVDALVIQSPEGPRTYTLVTADEAYRLLVEQIPEAALTLSHDGVILYSNGRLPELLGLPKEAVPGRSLVDFAAPGSRARVHELLQRGHHEVSNAEVELDGADGPTIPVQLSLSPLTSGVFRGICAVATDLREQKRRERAAADERLTRAILEFAGTAIIVCDGGGRILRANRAASDLFGPAVEGSFDGMFPEGPAFAELIRAADGEKRHELSYKRRGGGPVWLHGRARRIGDPGLSDPRWVVTLNDITDRKQIEVERGRLLEAERDARSRAEAANQAKTQFLAVMSHELRTPLSAVIGYADLLQEGVAGEPNPIQRHYVERIKASAWHLLGLIEGILTFSRVEAGKETTHIEPIDVVVIAREAAELVTTQATLKQLELRVVVPDDLPPALTDAAKLRQILVNLLANAVKFTDCGSVELKLERSGAYAIVGVRDTGKGIAPEDLDRIFEPFVQADQSSTRRNEGTGLGLTIARRFADLIGAEIGVQSEPDVGSTFTVRVPLTR